MAMEGMIARWYSKNTGRIHEQKIIFNKVKSEISPGAHVLEIAPGPGFLSIEFAKAEVYKVTALEISKTFIDIANENAKNARVNIDFRHGNASEMPFEENQFDFIICVAAFKNFSEPVESIREMYRVLKPGGKACIIDLRRDVPLEKIDRHIKEDLQMKGFNAWMTKFVFRHTLIKNAYTKAEIQDFVSQTKFERARIIEDTLGMDIWLEK
jgi:ubiquinone/menaquinone biosynthesis C-methylase UbiE